MKIKIIFRWCEKCGKYGRPPCRCRPYLIWDAEGALTVDDAPEYHGRDVERALEAYARHQCSQDSDYYGIFEDGHQVMVAVDGEEERYEIFGEPTWSFTSRLV